jgi:hypothetical protein
MTLSRQRGYYFPSQTGFPPDIKPGSDRSRGGSEGRGETIEWRGGELVELNRFPRAKRAWMMGALFFSRGGDEGESVATRTVGGDAGEDAGFENREESTNGSEAREDLLQNRRRRR